MKKIFVKKKGVDNLSQEKDFEEVITTLWYGSKRGVYGFFLHTRKDQTRPLSSVVIEFLGKILVDFEKNHTINWDARKDSIIVCFKIKQKNLNPKSSKS